MALSIGKPAAWIIGLTLSIMTTPTDRSSYTTFCFEPRNGRACLALAREPRLSPDRHDKCPTLNCQELFQPPALHTQLPGHHALRRRHSQHDSMTGLVSSCCLTFSQRVDWMEPLGIARYHVVEAIDASLAEGFSTINQPCRLGWWSQPSINIRGSLDCCSDMMFNTGCLHVVVVHLQVRRVDPMCGRTAAESVQGTCMVQARRCSVAKRPE
jgi:hypothetical protein